MKIIFNQRNKLRVFSLVLSLAMIMTLIPTTTYGAVKTKVSSPTYVTSYETTNADGTEYVKITTSGATINVEYKSQLPGVRYGVLLRQVGTNVSSSSTIKHYVNGNGSFSTSIDTSGISGTRYLLIARAADSSQAAGYSYVGGGHGYCFIGVPIKMTGSSATIAIYQDVINWNNKVRKSSTRTASKSKSTALTDISSLVFTDPVTNKKSIGTTTTKMKAYFKTVSKDVTKGATTNYEKMRKIYAYIADNMYYDTLAFQEGSRQYTNPYKNLYNLRNNKTSPNSVKTTDGSGTAKVATTCVGYAALVAALGRAQGIPCRVVYGHALTSPWNTWGTESSISTLDHWWAEAYVNGRWIVVDPTRGTNAKWDRTSFSSKGTWNEPVEGPLTYNYFDPSDQFLSNTHLYQGIK